MRIAVCVKQVPAASEGRTDMERGFVVRTGRKRLNPYDGPAIEAALRLREQYGGQVDIFSMGPPSAAEAVAEGLAMGADAGFLMTDRAFAGADSLATARTLAAGLGRTGDYDLYLCGQKTTDGDTGQVGPALAALLGRPFIGRVTGFEAADDHSLTLRHKVGRETQLIQAALPLVLSITRQDFTARMPSLKMKLRKRPVQELTLADLPGQDGALLGSHGSPTRIKRVYFPEPRPTGDLRQVDGRQAADLILKVLRELS